MNTDTPRTDAEFARYPILDTQMHGDAVGIEFARTFERENQRLLSKLEEVVLEMASASIERDEARERAARLEGVLRKFESGICLCREDLLAKGQNCLLCQAREALAAGGGE